MQSSAVLGSYQMKRESSNSELPSIKDAANLVKSSRELFNKYQSEGKVRLSKLPKNYDTMNEPSSEKEKPSIVQAKAKNTSLKPQHKQNYSQKNSKLSNIDKHKHKQRKNSDKNDRKFAKTTPLNSNKAKNDERKLKSNNKPSKSLKKPNDLPREELKSSTNGLEESKTEEQPKDENLSEIEEVSEEKLNYLLEIEALKKELQEKEEALQSYKTSDFPVSLADIYSEAEQKNFIEQQIALKLQAKLLEKQEKSKAIADRLESLRQQKLEDREVERNRISKAKEYKRELDRQAKAHHQFMHNEEFSFMRNHNPHSFVYEKFSPQKMNTKKAPKNLCSNPITGEIREISKLPPLRNL